MNGRGYPLISVVTVVRNGVDTIEDTILSVLGQTYANVEFIIVDGESTDGTSSIVGKYISKVSRYIREVDFGIYDAMNKACYLATGDFLLFLGADDVIFTRQTLGNIAQEIIRRNDSESIYYGDAVFVDRKVVYSGKFGPGKLSLKNVCHQSVFYPRSLYSVMRYNTIYRIHADYEYNLRAFSKRTSIHLNMIVSIFNDSGSSRVGDLQFRRDKFAILLANYGLYYALLSKVARPLVGVLSRLGKLLVRLF